MSHHTLAAIAEQAMCLICTDLNKGSLTFKEAKRNLNELTFSAAIEPDHAAEVSKIIRDQEEEYYAEISPEPFDPFWHAFGD